MGPQQLNVRRHPTGARDPCVMRQSRFLLAALLLLGLGLVWPAEAQYWFHFGRNKIQYEDFDWHVLKTDHFDIYFYPEMQELAEHGAAFAEEAYTELQNKFNFSLGHRTPIVFYSSNLHFKQTNVTDGFIPDGVGGFFEFLKGRVVIPANGNLHRFRRVIRHEIVHVFTLNKVARAYRDHRIPPDRFLPLWFTEGLAEYWSGEPDFQHEMVMRDALFSNFFTGLQNIYRINGTYFMYKEGEALCHFIAETFGEEKLLEMMDNAWRDRDFRRVMEYVLREDFQVIGDRWEDWLKEEYYPRLSGAEVPTLLTAAVSARGFNSKPVVYRHLDGQRQVFFVGNHSGYSNLYQVDVDDEYRPIAKPQPLIRGERGGRFESFHMLESRLSISPNGMLAFVTKSGENDVIHTYDLHARRYGDSYGFDGLIAVYSPTWSPDGKKLAFSSIDQSGHIDLYLFDLAQGALQRLTRDLYDDRDPAWSPDGRYLAFSSDRTSLGHQHAYNLFRYDLQSGIIDYITFGNHHDFSPRWSPDGKHIVFTSARKDSSGRYGGQDIYVVHAAATLPPLVAIDSMTAAPGTWLPSAAPSVRRLTHLTTAAFDPVWTEDQYLIFTSFENFNFTIRSLGAVDSLLANAKQQQAVNLAAANGTPWQFPSIKAETQVEKIRYRRRYGLDVAQGQISNNAIWGTSGGAVLSFSDLLGDDRLFLMLYSTGQFGGSLLKSMNIELSRLELHRRTNVGYGVFRYGGRRYDFTDPDASLTFPWYWEEVYGAFGAVSFPISKFKRIELSTAASYDRKQIPENRIDREAYLVSSSVALVHDNALFGMNGPVDGWRAKLSVAYTTDVRYSRVNYVTVAADIRKYFRIHRNVTYAVRAMVRGNHGREARLWFMGGSWDLRGYPLFDVRGNKMWFTSNELRFSILDRPFLYMPLLAAFGISNLRGALFFDAAHAWNDGYRERIPQIFAGETLGSAGLGFRLNLFGGFVLRYDLGYRFREGFTQRDDHLFRQFFFGYDF